jgi:hypothetical protein
MTTKVTAVVSGARCWRASSQSSTLRTSAARTGPIKTPAGETASTQIELVCSTLGSDGHNWVMLLRRHTTRDAEYGDLLGCRRSRRGGVFKNQQTQQPLPEPACYLLPNIEVVSPKPELRAELRDHLIDRPPLPGSNRIDIRVRRRANKNGAAKGP